MRRGSRPGFVPAPGFNICHSYTSFFIRLYALQKPVTGSFPGCAGKTGCRAAHRAASRLAPPGFHPSPRVNGIASGGLTATALPPFAAGELQGSHAAISAGACRQRVRKAGAVLHGGWLPAGTLPHPAGYYVECRQG